MGGRGSSFSRGGATGGVSAGQIVSTSSLISAREIKQTEVDQVLTALRNVAEQYGQDLNDVQLAKLSPGSSAMAYYDANGNLAINETYFDSTKMDDAYDRCTAMGFHPSRGSKSALEAVAAHEIGHHLTEIAGMRVGYGAWHLDQISTDIMSEAAAQLSMKSMSAVAAQISGYAKADHAEAVAEAFSDVYCNGNSASAASRTVVDILGRYLRR